MRHYIVQVDTEKDGIKEYTVIAPCYVSAINWVIRNTKYNRENIIGAYVKV